MRNRIKNPKRHDEHTLSELELSKIVSELFPTHEINDWEKPVFDKNSIPPVTESEVSQALSKMKIGKAPGPDYIDTILLKMYVESHLADITKMLNNLLESGNFPRQWKAGRLALLVKPTKSLERKYRPICMLNSFSKLFEYILYERILAFTRLSENQFGFRRGRSTIDSMRALKRIYDENRFIPLKHRRLLCLIGLDVKNAFNSLRWRDVIKVLIEQMAPPYIVAIIQSYFSDRQLIANGKCVTITSGAAQGSILGPLFWNLVYDAIVSIKIDPSKILAYADDLLVILSGYDGPSLGKFSNLTTKVIKKELDKKGLAFEASKTDAMFLDNRRKYEEGTEIIVDDVPITVKSSIRHLGFHLDKNLDMTHHISVVCDKVRKVAFGLRSIMPNTYGPAFRKKRIIVSSVLSILFYGILFWGDSKGATLKKSINLISTTLRPLKRSLCCAYRTVSKNCLDMISGVPPEDLLIRERFRRAQKIEDPAEVEADTQEIWCQRWLSSRVDTWCRRIINDPLEWLRRDHGAPDFYLTQFLTGHGSFGTYLHRFKLIPSPYCSFCSADLDTQEHTFFECPISQDFRSKAERLTGQTLTPDNIMRLMLESNENWKIILEFIRKTLDIKIKNFRNLKSKSNLPAEDMPQGDSGVSQSAV